MNETAKAKYGLDDWGHVVFTPADWSEELSIPGLVAGEKLNGTNSASGR